MTDNNRIVVVGGGPAGLAAGIYISRAMLKPLIIEGANPGGQLTLTSEVENYPGADALLGADLVAKMREQAEGFGAEFISEDVKSIIFSERDGHKLILTNNREIQAQAVLLTTGACAKWLGLEAEKRFIGKGISACATCDGFFFKDKVVAVVGGGDTAMEEATTLSKFAEKIYVIHRRSEFRASQIMQKEILEDPKITVLWDAEVEDILGDQRVEKLKLKFLSEKSRNLVENNILNVDGVFIAIGHTPNTEFLVDSGLILNEKGYIITSEAAAWEMCRNKALDQKKEPDQEKALDQEKKLDQKKEPDQEKAPDQGKKPHMIYIFSDFNRTYKHSTNIEGVFAAGDVVDFVYRQASTAVGSGVEAALEIEMYITDKQKKK